jgi:tRNA-dihydrouridine synthase
VLGRIAAELAGRRPPPAPSGTALADLVREHYQTMLGFYGRDLGARVARKHLGWYLDGVAAGGLRREVLTADDPAAVLRALGSLADCGPAEAAA